ncbi:MAG TPA: serine/threonine-protein kinase [Thermoanaerobaculia bacterium]|nr:serine/threonine-protein kinase [Thermoanaerobaculia bacterium]
MAVPEKIGKYEISEQIGVGGFGAVYKGRDPFIKRTVAVKTCQLNDPEIKSRFFREAELAGNLHHRNITTIYDFGVENDIPYIVQEFLSGEDLDKIIKRGEKLTPARKIEILIHISEGLHFAHEAHVIHRDIKPANIRILENGAVKIMDFGIAKSLQSESQLTQTGITLGTSAYLAPEQIRGETLDRRTDVFALGVLAYELLAYQKPFRGEHLSTILYRILNEAPEPIDQIAPEVTPALAAIVNKAIEKNIQNRYPSMEAMRQDLISVYRQVAGGSGAIPTGSFSSASPGAAAPFDPDETIKTPSKGMETSHITPPSGALARVPAPEDATVISEATPLPAPPPSPKSGGLELVNFRDPSQRTGDAKPEAAAEAAAAVPSGGSNKGVMIGAGLAAAAVIGIGVFLLMRSKKPEVPAPAPSETAAKAPTAPIVFPAPQVGQDSASAAKPAPPAAPPKAKAAEPKPAEEKVAEKSASKKSEKNEAPAKAAKTYKVQFSSIPVATLSVDGKKIGPSIPAQVVDLSEGKHTLRFETPDFPPYEKSFTVSSSANPPIAYRFPVGVLVINSPAWAGANVLIDSKFKGILIGEKSFQITAGPHKVTLSREGVNPYTTEVNVSDGEKKTLSPPEPTKAQEGSS